MFFIGFKLTKLIKHPVAFFADGVTNRRTKKLLKQYKNVSVERSELTNTIVVPVDQEDTKKLDMESKPLSFQYKVSVIVPVYNVEKELPFCLNSLVAQTINKDEIEVLLINDGSTDDSLNLCLQYANIFPFFKVFTKENEGLSATRNYGIRKAKGKYLMYLDSDDAFSPETIESVTQFFDSVYETVDLVAFRDQEYTDGKKSNNHFRYLYLKNTGVYDLNEIPYICQTRVTVCVKNKGEHNVFFDETKNFRHEDQQYNNDVLANQLKIGYCAQGEYLYIRRPGSIMGTSMYPMYIFDTTIAYYEKLFSNYPDRLPKYYQAMFVHDMNWKLNLNILYPYERYEYAREKISLLLSRVDEKIILNFPKMNNFRKHYFIKLKNNINKFDVIVKDEYVEIKKQNISILKIKSFEIIVCSLKNIDGKVKLLGFLKSPLFTYIDGAIVNIKVKDICNNETIYRPKLSIAGFSYYKSKEQEAEFYIFQQEFQENICEFSFTVSIAGYSYEYPTTFYFMPSSPFVEKESVQVALLNNKMLSFCDNNFSIDEVDTSVKLRELIQQFRKKLTYEEFLLVDSSLNLLLSHKETKIWLYYDCRGVNFDNGYYQFVHDFYKEDGVKRFYINANDDIHEGLFDDKQILSVVKFGSFLHKILYLAADKILTAYIEDKNVIPFSMKELNPVKFIRNQEIIYLQHGILHAHLPWKYTPDRIMSDKIVVSSYFELDNFTQNYGWSDLSLIRSGMPRFDFIERKKSFKKRILFAPSWRNYLIGNAQGNQWELATDKFLSSSYFKGISKILSSEKLQEILEQYDYWMDFKIHPIFKPYLEYFNFSQSRINSIDDVKQDDYAIFITDFSSFVFDFAYLCRAIVYYLPDELEFLSGMNQYRELDLPFEKAFGNKVDNVDDLVSEIKHICSLNGLPDKKFYNRMKKFFLPFNNDCRENIYKSIR